MDPNTRMSAPRSADPPTTTSDRSEPDDLAARAGEAFVYTFPLFEMLRMRANTAPRRNARGEFADTDAHGTRRWLNTFAHSRRLLKAGESRVVTPNYDTLYSSAWLDLRDSPRVLNVPDTADRYYVLGLLDAYTNPFCHLGRRTTGTHAQRFWLTGPDWQGDVPAGMQHVRCPTPMVWIIGRLLVDGAHDVARANALQDGFVITHPRGDEADGVVVDTGPTWQTLPEDAATYFAVVAQALRQNPPPPQDAAMLARLAPLGLGQQDAVHPPPEIARQPDAAQTRAPAQDARVDSAGREARAQAVQAGYDAARQALQRSARRLRGQDESAKTASAPQPAAPPPSSWVMPALLGESFGTDYRTRARIALGYIGALCSAEAVYPMAYTDAHGALLDGRHRYRLRFAPGTLPPVDAFWSLTVYRTADFMLVPNALDRYAIGDRSPHLHWGEDGSLEIAIQHDAPQDTANWLPAPEAGFYLCLRAYQPHAVLLEGRYRLPDVERLEAG